MKEIISSGSSPEANPKKSPETDEKVLRIFKKELQKD